MAFWGGKRLVVGAQGLGMTTSKKAKANVIPEGFGGSLGLLNLSFVFVVY